MKKPQTKLLSIIIDVLMFLALLILLARPIIIRLIRAVKGATVDDWGLYRDIHM